MVKSKLFALCLISQTIYFIGGCNRSGENIDFPVDENEFSVPVVKKLSFSEPINLEWEIANADNIKPWPVKKFDLNKLPSKQFDIGNPKALLKPLDVKKFDWDAVEDTIFNKDALPVEPLKFKTKILGEPKKIKAGMPHVKSGTTRGLMEFNINSGMPGTGRCMIQDKHGLIWIGTDKGLVRYDGENLDIYGLEQGVFDNNIYSIIEDRKGRIWIGSSSGNVQVLDKEAGMISIVETSYEKGPVYFLIQDSLGQIWAIQNRHGIHIINEAEGKLRKFSSSEGLNDDFTVGVMQDNKGLIWIGTGNGANIIDWTAGKNKRLKKADGLSEASVFVMMQDKDDRIWLAGEGDQAQVLDINKKTISFLGRDQGMPKFDFVVCFLQDKEGTVWMGDNKGKIIAFDEKAETIQIYKATEEVAGNLNIILNLHEDRNGHIWVGTFSAGTYYINRNNGRPGNFTTVDGLSNTAIWSILEAKNGWIWMGTSKGIDIYDPTTGNLRHIGKEQGLLTDRSVNLIEDKQGRIWVSGNEFGISIVDVVKGTVTGITNEGGLFSNYISSIVEDNDGQIWLGSARGVVSLVDTEKQKIRKLINLPEFIGTRLNTLRKDKSGKIWVGSVGGGLALIDHSGNELRKLNTDGGLITNDVNTIMEDTRGNIWIGEEKGIQVLNQKDSTITNFTEQEGLSANGIYTIDERKGIIYAGTARGFTLLTPVTSTQMTKPSWNISYIGKDQGLTYLDVDGNSSLISSKGELWAGVEENILTIIDDIKTDTIVANTFITGINILDKQQQFYDNKIFADRLNKLDTLWNKDLDTFYVNKQIPADTGYLSKNKISWETISGPYSIPVNLRLPYNQNYLSFNFTGSNIANPDKTKYRYLLQGIDKHWSAISEKPFSENYRDLPAGDYVFKVSSKGMNGLWSQPAEISFTILPPWWKTWWAYLLYSVFAIGILGFYIQYRSRALKQDNLLLEEKVVSRTNELRKSLNELRDTQFQLVQSEKMASLGELTAGIAHEIQNPLNFVNNFSEISIELVDELSSELKNSEIANEKKDNMQAILEDLIQNQQKINLHGKRADSIVKGMLQHSRSSSGVKEPTDINALADEYLRLSYHGLRAKDNSFNAVMKTDFDPSIGKINIVPQDMGRVLLNLYNNAFYAVSAEAIAQADGDYQPKVIVSTKKRNGWIEISVKDNGSGIPDSVKEKIFQPFFTTKPTGHGTGLGLSLSYDIVKAHNGELNVESEEGQGAKFILRLPI